MNFTAIKKRILDGELIRRCDLKAGDIVCCRPSWKHSRGILRVEKVSHSGSRITAFYLGQDGKPITDDGHLNGPVRLTEDEYRRVTQETVNMAVGYYAEKNKPQQTGQPWFVDSKGRPFRVCQTKHKPEKKCSRHHETPADALWSGQVNPELKGELIEQARECRKEYRRKNGRWLNRRKRMVKSVETAAPAFRGYAQSMLDKHDAIRPALNVTLDATRFAAAPA